MLQLATRGRLSKHKEDINNQLLESVKFNEQFSNKIKIKKQ
jgi:hypothetical protein